MSGKYSELQSRIKEHNPTAVYIPCSSHSLNLILYSAAECCNIDSQYFYSNKIYVPPLLLQLIHRMFYGKTTRLWRKIDSLKIVWYKMVYKGRRGPRSKMWIAYLPFEQMKKLTIIKAKSFFRNMNKYEIALMTII